MNLVANLPTNTKIAKAFEKEVWAGEFGNASSPYLAMTWVAIFDAFSKAIKLNSSNTNTSRGLLFLPLQEQVKLNQCVITPINWIRM
jgi:hypothetical protein